MVDSWLSLLHIITAVEATLHPGLTTSIPLSNRAQRRTYAHDSDHPAENQNRDDIDDKDTGVTSCR